MRRFFYIFCFLIVLMLAANSCAPLPATQVSTPVPGLVSTLIVQTSEAAQTQAAASLPASATASLSPAKTNTPFPSETPTFVFKLSTPTHDKVLTPTPFTLDAWPIWGNGAVVEMPQGSGEGTGTTRYLMIMNGAMVKVTREHGVKLRKLPTKAAGGKLAPTGSFLELTGLWNKNKNFTPNFSFVKVRAPDGHEYWVGGTEGEDTDPMKSLAFDLPLTPTPEGSETPTPTLFYIIFPKFPTATGTPGIP
jgi:hypothetical protein